MSCKANNTVPMSILDQIQEGATLSFLRWAEFSLFPRVTFGVTHRSLVIDPVCCLHFVR